MSSVDKGRRAAATGAANENRLLAALLSRDYNASRVDLPHSPYDLVVDLKEAGIIRIQVKTASGGSIGFTGGSRGGVDRDYKSDVKTYVQSTETSDVVVGVVSNIDNGDSSTDYYFIPTLYIEKLNQKSISVNKVKQTKNNWELLRRCRDSDYVFEILPPPLKSSLL